MLLLFPPTEGDILLASCDGGGDGIVFRTRRDGFLINSNRPPTGSIN